MNEEDDVLRAYHEQMEAEDMAWLRRHERDRKLRLVLAYVGMGLGAGVFIVLLLLEHWH